MGKSQTSNNLSFYKKLFFSLKKVNKKQEISINLGLTSNQQKTKALRSIKIKLASYRVINQHLLFQRSSTYLAQFFKNNINETAAGFLTKNPLGQNNLLFDPENLWNNFVGVKQDRLSTFYFISRYPSAKYHGKYHIAQNKKFKRTECRSFHVNDLIFRM